jgi:hypothetical protein
MEGRITPTDEEPNLKIFVTVAKWTIVAASSEILHCIANEEKESENERKA